MEGGAKSGYTHARHVHVLDAIMPPSSSSTPFSSIGILAFRLDAPRQNCLFPRNDTAAQLVLRCVPRVKQNSLCEAKRRIDSLSTFRRSSKNPPSPLPRPPPLSTFFFFRSELIPPFPLLRRIGREWRGGLLCQLFPSFVPSKWLQRNSITNRG